MGLLQIKNLVHIKENSYYSKETAYGMTKKSFLSFDFYKGLISRIFKKLQILNTKTKIPMKK
jgi:hypothetical protein